MSNNSLMFIFQNSSNFFLDIFFHFPSYLTKPSLRNKSHVTHLLSQHMPASDWTKVHLSGGGSLYRADQLNPHLPLHWGYSKPVPILIEWTLYLMLLYHIYSHSSDEALKWQHPKLYRQKYLQILIYPLSTFFYVNISRNTLIIFSC